MSDTPEQHEDPARWHSWFDQAISTWCPRGTVVPLTLTAKEFLDAATKTLNIHHLNVRVIA